MTGAPNPTRRRSYLALAKEADAILKRANCDTTTGGKQDRQYRRNKRAESERLARILDLATTGGICNGTLNEEGPRAITRAGPILIPNVITTTTRQRLMPNTPRRTSASSRLHSSQHIWTAIVGLIEGTVSSRQEFVRALPARRAA